MNNYKKIIVLIMAFFALSASRLNAESWWEKGLEILTIPQESKQSKDLTSGEIGKAFKEALRIGSENVVKQLGSVDGFNTDAAIHIPLPDELITVKTMLAKIGMSQLTDDLELKLNRTAEVATKEVKALFWQAIADMTFKDIMAIYEGPEDSATKYFKEKMSQALSRKMKPIVENSLAKVGAVKAYDSVIGKYQALPFVPDVKANLTTHVVEKGLDGIFYYIAKEEAAIRKDPVKQTTALLKRVFSTK